MKTTKWLFLSVAIMGFLGTNTAWAEQILREARITSIQGQVEVQKSGAADWQVALQDHKLQNGDKVKTGPGAQATITLDEGSAIAVSENSELSVQNMVTDSESGNSDSILAILKGELKADITPLKLGSHFAIETPLVIATVVGTTFNIGLGADGSVTVTTESGSVSLDSQGENQFTATVDGGDSITIFQNPATGEIRITNTSGTPVTLQGPDGAETTLNPGQSVSFNQDGAATFTPVPNPTDNPPGGNGAGEPASGQDTSASGV